MIARITRCISVMKLLQEPDTVFRFDQVRKFPLLIWQRQKRGTEKNHQSLEIDAVNGYIELRKEYPKHEYLTEKSLKIEFGCSFFYAIFPNVRGKIYGEFLKMIFFITSYCNITLYDDII